MTASTGLAQVVSAEFGGREAPTVVPPDRSRSAEAFARAVHPSSRVQRPLLTVIEGGRK